MLHQLGCVQRPFINLLKGFRSAIHAQDRSGHHLCRMCTQAPPRALALNGSALSGSPPSWVHSTSWVTPPYVSFPSFCLKLTDMVGTKFQSAPTRIFGQSPVNDERLETKPMLTSLSIIDASFKGFNTDKRWMPPWVEIGTDFQWSPSTGILTCFEACPVDGRWVPPSNAIILRSDGTDRRWVPPRNGF